MRLRIVPFALAALLVAAAPAEAARKPAKPRRQARHAVGSQATPPTNASPWATVNFCDPADRPGAIGVRASMPERADGLEQWMRIRIQYFSDADRAWRVVRSGGDSGWDRIGDGSQTVESGWTFTFQLPSAGHRLVMRGLVDYEWRHGTAVDSRARALTELGHVDTADPLLGDSRSSCQIQR